jgi:hypothetical protein
MKDKSSLRLPERITLAKQSLLMRCARDKRSGKGPPGCEAGGLVVVVAVGPLASRFPLPPSPPCMRGEPLPIPLSGRSAPTLH